MSPFGLDHKSIESGLGRGYGQSVPYINGIGEQNVRDKFWVGGYYPF